MIGNSARLLFDTQLQGAESGRLERKLECEAHDFAFLFVGHDDDLITL
jgi:hypothetical protein